MPPPTPVQAVQASIGGPLGAAADSQGNVFFTSLNCVFKIDGNGALSRVAGTSRGDYSGDGGPATSAMLSFPSGVAVDASGNLFIADLGNNRIRKLTPAGLITTVAGNGILGYSGDGGPATSAELDRPSDVAVDASGNLFIADNGNNRIRKVTAAGIITTVTGSGSAGYSGDGGSAASAELDLPWGVAVDASGNLFIADYGNSRIRKVTVAGIITTVAGNGSTGYSGDGGPGTSAQLDGPNGVTVDASGNLFIADSISDRIRKLTPAGIITTVAGNGFFGYSGDGGPATSLSLSQPVGVAIDTSGNLFIADYSNSRIRKVTLGGIITTVAGNGLGDYSGDGGPATSAVLFGPTGVAIDTSGNLFIADILNNRIRKVTPAGIITTVAGNGSFGYSGDDGPATSAQLYYPNGVAVDTSGNLFIADTQNNAIRKVTPAGIITTTYGVYSGPSGVAIDTSGNLFIADTYNCEIHKVTPGGTITTVAGNGSLGYSGDGGLAILAELNLPWGVAVDASDNLFIAEYGNNRIRKVTPAGIITTVAGNGHYGYSGDGGPATSGQLAEPSGVAVDTSGNLFIADSNNSRIRKVTPAGIITTIAGNGFFSYSGDGGPAVGARLDYPTGVAVDTSGNVFIADTQNNAIRLLTPSATSCSYSLSATSFDPPASGESLTLTITTDSGCAWSLSKPPDWIAVSGPTSGSRPATITLIVAPNSGPPRSAQISVSGISSVTVSQASTVLLVNTGGVVNAASFKGPVAAGSIVSIFGNFLLATPVAASSFPILDSLGGLSFQFAEAPLTPLFYANAGQANGQIPWELADQSQTNVMATVNGQTSSAQSVSLSAYAPGIFATNGGGTGQGAILDLNYHLVDSTNPTTAGNYVQIFCTGLGPVTNQPATGAPASGALSTTTIQPLVKIGGAVADVQFSGLTPGFVGLYQVNAKVPGGATKGSAEPVWISIGGAQSNTVTIAVQ